MAERPNVILIMVDQWWGDCLSIDRHLVLHTFDHGVNCNSVVARPWDKSEHLHPTNSVVTQAIDFLTAPRPAQALPPLPVLPPPTSTLRSAGLGL